MDQHPVPQNVTTFQFRLIGDMTIKQFGFLAGGAILAFISYKLPLPFFFSWPLTIVFALGGVGFAFVPIEERPMDVWVLSFLKNVYSPTVFEWAQSPSSKQPSAQQQRYASAIPKQQVAPIKTSVPQPLIQKASQLPIPQNTLIQTPPSMGDKTTASVIGTMYAPKATAQSFQVSRAQQAQPSVGMFDWIFDLFKPKNPPIAVSPARPTQAPHMATPSVVGSHLDISMPPTVAKQQINEKPMVEATPAVSVTGHTDTSSILTRGTESDAKISDLQKQLADALAQKEKLAQEMKNYQPQPATTKNVSTPAPQQFKQQQTTTPTYPPKQVAQTPTAQKQPTVKIITPEGAVRAGLPRLTTFPNVVTGITKDSDNNFLPGVLVTVKDKEGIPVRALKTNRLGQFAASTPLSNGVYFVEIEDPRQRYTFDRVQITLNGSIVPALEIITKSQKQISRDKLAKELFGTT